jgi:type I restriction enzyme S subunit
MRDKWKSINLVEIADIKRGLPSQDLNYVENTNEGIRLIRINDFKSDSPKYIIETEKTQKLTIKKGDILIAGTGATAGISFLVNDLWDGLPFSYNAPRIRVKKGNDKNYVYYILNSSKIKQQQNRLFTGNAQPFLDTRAIGSFKIPLPPLPEQQKIAEILSTVDAKIEIIDQQISETQELKKGLMQQLLSKGIGHTEFKDSALGKIPKNWEVLELVKHIKLLSGFAFKSNGFNEEGKGVKLLRGINITIGKLRWNDKIDRWWNLPLDDFDKYSAKTGDLVISMDGSLVGRNYARVKEEDLPLLLVQRVACLRANRSLDLEFLNQIIGSPLWLNYVDAVKTSSGIPHISAKNIREFKIPFPSFEEQNQIAEILSSVDNKLQVLSQKKITYQEMKQGLMQQLLTGKVRV